MLIHKINTSIRVVKQKRLYHSDFAINCIGMPKMVPKVRPN